MCLCDFSVVVRLQGLLFGFRRRPLLPLVSPGKVSAVCASGWVCCASRGWVSGLGPSELLHG